MLLTELSLCRLRSVCTHGLVKILPYRPPARLITAKYWADFDVLTEYIPRAPVVCAQLSF